MTASIADITFDAGDAQTLAKFWATLLGWQVFYDDDPEVLVAPHFPSDGTGLLFIPVPEGKTAKNRVHLDLAPTDLSRDEQVAQALAIGATIHEDHREDDGSGWVTLLDPEGNEFCIVRAASERAAPTTKAWRLG